MSEPEPVWHVEVVARAERDLDRLTRKVAEAIIEFITATLPTNPWRMSKPLTGEFEGIRSARRGDYRVLFEIDVARHVLVILRIAHRSHVYRAK